jgi:hypothetical protein
MKLRIAAEILGGALYVAVHFPLAFIYAMGSSLQGVLAAPYWVAITFGYAVMFGLAAARPGRFRAAPLRRAFDTWLLAAVPALTLSAVLVWSRWPLEFPGWNGHGLGAQGGEANAVFFPWLQGLCWVLSTALLPRPRE